MSRRIAFIACLIGACSRNDRASSSPDPGRPAPNTGVPSPSISSTPLADLSASEGSAVATPLAAPRTVSRAILSIAASGYTSGLRLESDTVSYCDNRGGRVWALATGSEGNYKRQCPSAKLQERNSACEGIKFVTQVREPGPDDIIDIAAGPSVPVRGHIHDCAFESGALLVATGVEVVTIDVKTGHRDVKGREGGNQVAINGDWLAWSDGEKVFAQRR